MASSLFTEAAVILGALYLCFAMDRQSLLTIKHPKLTNEPLFEFTAAITLLAVVLLGLLWRCLSNQMRSCKQPDKFSGLFPSSAQNSLPDLSEKTQITAILPRQQTEEWKGWMQALILLYHYFGMSKVLWVYQIVRLLVASYLFMTGFGHTIFLLKTRNFSLQRVAAVLFRLNLLTVLLAYVMATDYNLYYFPALSSFWFLVVYLTLLPGYGRTYTLRWMLGRCLISMIIVRVLGETPGIMEVFCSGLKTCLKMNVEARELRFRIYLDRYIVYVGMMFGSIYHHHISEGTHLKPQILLPKTALYRRALIVTTASLTLFAYFWMAQTFANKFDYNIWHPLISPVPILAYVALRNTSRILRSNHSLVFAWLGRCSLETFILQYHMWLGADSKEILHLNIFDPETVTMADGLSGWMAWVEFAVITALFLWTSSLVSTATGALTAAFMKEDSRLSKRFVLLVTVLVLANWVY